MLRSFGTSKTQVETMNIVGLTLLLLLGVVFAGKAGTTAASMMTKIYERQEVALEKFTKLNKDAVKWQHQMEEDNPEDVDPWMDDKQWRSKGQRGSLNSLLGELLG
ncbi:uncharacterized protein LOC125378788 [Haliotis rufescens]|uniref:uncharacterized protein LOC125378788 n=1 Tax=Haliotis rufescens TaxID=6454 RepID=UPI00201F6C81|nr:uncharacterized protein LOC125378788 [Haliotis rufescens]